MRVAKTDLNCVVLHAGAERLLVTEYELTVVGWFMVGGEVITSEQIKAKVGIK